MLAAPGSKARCRQQLVPSQPSARRLPGASKMLVYPNSHASSKPFAAGNPGFRRACFGTTRPQALHRHSQIPASGDLAQASRCSSRSLRTSKTFSEAGRPRQTAETPAWHGQTLNCSWVPCRSAEWPLLACEQGLDFRLRRSGHAACPFLNCASERRVARTLRP